MASQATWKGSFVNNGRHDGEDFMTIGEALWLKKGVCCSMRDDGPKASDMGKTRRDECGYHESPSLHG